MFMGRNIRTSQKVNSILKAGLQGGVVMSSMVLPGMAILADPIFKSVNKLEKKVESRRLLTLMRRQALVEVTELPDGKLLIELTEKGKKRALVASLDDLSISSPVRWDGKWRIVIFDVPERYKAGRDAMTARLQSLGFRMLQRSVWVHPFPCLEQISAITHAYAIKPFVSLAIVEEINDHNRLVHQFRKLILPVS
jgi:DNA-binding transcriptional regulator PaaX